MSSIPVYPSFRDLEITDKSAFDGALAACPPEISELTFTNLYCWKEAYQFKVSMLQGFLIIRSDAKELPVFFPPVGRIADKAVILRILHDSGGQFNRVPEDVLRLFEGDASIRSIEDPDNFDYVYGFADLTVLKGGKYDGKRNLIKKFKSTCAYEYHALDATYVHECAAFEETWCSLRDCAHSAGLSHERKAFEGMINNFSAFSLKGGVLKVNRQIVAVAIAEKLNPQTLVMHILKADPGVAGGYQTMLWEFLSHESEKFTLVNLEQDLGLEGLKKSKLSYYPQYMVKKYKLQLASSNIRLILFLAAIYLNAIWVV
ncbi:MAG: phosphatidylglycerol lysyltransferase domain-containing protein [Candidatus Omnitrophota bacterium]|jgi:hypothetical protein